MAAVLEQLSEKLPEQSTSTQEKKSILEANTLEHDFAKEFDERNFTHFLKEFYSLCNIPSKPQTKSNLEEAVRHGLIEFSNRLRSEISDIQENAKSLPSLKDTPYIKVAKENPLLLLYAMHSCRVLDTEGFYWAKLLYPQTIERISDPLILFGMLEYLSHFRCFFIIYPEYNNDDFLLSENIISLCGNAQGFYEYLKKYYESVPLKMEGILLLNAMHKLPPNSYGIGKGLRNLHFLLSNGLNFQKIDAKFGKWYLKIQWQNLGEQDAFLFEHIDKSPDKKEILEYIKVNFPDLVYQYYLKGNFFIGNQLIAMGLPAPKIEVESFLINAIEQGLQQSRELKKYPVFLLMAHSMGLVSDQDLKMIDASTLAENGALLKKVRDIIPEMVKRFVKLYSEFANESPQCLNSIMRIIEKEYTVALSTIYNLPIFDCSKGFVKCYRGIKFLKSSINSQYLQYIFDYGHASNFYGFLGSGYNRSVYEEVIEGPRMAWNCWSDTTCISPDIKMAINFADPSAYYDAYVLSIKYSPGHPLFFGNWLTVGYDETPKLPHQFEVPHIAPQNIEGIFKMARIEYTSSIVEVLYKPRSDHQKVTSHEGEKLDPTGLMKQHSSLEDHFASLLECYNSHIHFPYRDFLQLCNNLLLRTAFNQYKRLFDLSLPLSETWQSTHENLRNIGHFTPAMLRLIMNYLGNDREDVYESVPSPMVMFSSGLKLKKIAKEYANECIEDVQNKDRRPQLA